jgi:uncharacterized protein (DUF2147 family)
MLESLRAFYFSDLKINTYIMNKKNALLGLAIFSFSLFGQELVGKWKTIDDETQKDKSIVEIYEKNGKYYGKVLEIFDPAKKNNTCSLCEDKDDRKDKPVEGMEIVRDMQKKKNEYKDGTILDPKKGKVYDCKMFFEEGHPDVLKVRGYLAFFYRTQTWHRVK